MNLLLNSDISFSYLLRVFCFS